MWRIFIVKFYFVVARRGASLGEERGGADRRQGARRSAAVPNGEGVASGSATLNFEIFYKFNNLTIIICRKSNL